MKTIILLALSVFIFPVTLTGQTSKFEILSEYRKPGSLYSKQSPDNQLSINSDINSDLFNERIYEPDFILKQKRFSIESPVIKSTDKTLLAEIYPGSDRFYAKRPYMASPYEKSFIIKPDTTVKYYLIIKDPVSKRITK